MPKIIHFHCCWQYKNGQSRSVLAKTGKGSPPNIPPSPKPAQIPIWEPHTLQSEQNGGGSGGSRFQVWSVSNCCGSGLPYNDFTLMEAFKVPSVLINFFSFFSWASTQAVFPKNAQLSYILSMINHEQPRKKQLKFYLRPQILKDLTLLPLR